MAGFQVEENSNPRDQLGKSGQPKRKTREPTREHKRTTREQQESTREQQENKQQENTREHQNVEAKCSSIPKTVSGEANIH